MNPIIFYHNADLDGKCSAAIVLRYERQVNNRDCELYGINYGDRFPWEKVSYGDPSAPNFQESLRRVYMVDFSLQPFEQMRQLAMLSRLSWIDHHKTALDAHAMLAEPLPGTHKTEIGKAGCELTWELLYPNLKMPHAVMLLGRYDVWDEKCTAVPWSHILAFQYGMRLRDTEPEDLLWSELLGDQGIENEVDRLKAICAGGTAILTYERKQNEIAMSACGFETTFEGHPALAANRGPANSQLFASKWDPEKHDIMIAFYWSHRGEWKVSIYTTKDGIDCGALCKKHGGGGHPKAAGFQCTTLPFAMESSR